MSACGYTSLAEAIEYAQPGVVSRTLYVHRDCDTSAVPDDVSVVRVRSTNADDWVLVTRKDAGLTAISEARLDSLRAQSRESSEKIAADVLNRHFGGEPDIACHTFCNQISQLQRQDEGRDLMEIAFHDKYGRWP